MFRELKWASATSSFKMSHFHVIFDVGLFAHFSFLELSPSLPPWPSRRQTDRMTRVQSDYHSLPSFLVCRFSSSSLTLTRMIKSLVSQSVSQSGSQSVHPDRVGLLSPHTQPISSPQTCCILTSKNVPNFSELNGVRGHRTDTDMHSIIQEGCSLVSRSLPRTSTALVEPNNFESR